jgi:hypothetical protein
MSKEIEISVDGSTVVFTSRFGEIRANPADFSDEIITKLIRLGISTKVGNASHMARNPQTGASASLKDKMAAMTAVHEMLLEGKWSSRKAGMSISRQESLICRATAAVQKVTEATMSKRIDDLAEKRGETRRQILNRLARQPDVLRAIAEIRAAESDIDVDDLLDELA